MRQHAVFIDAGYLLSQGSFLAKGRRLKHDSISVATEQLRNMFYNLDSSYLLRIYWYDGIARNGELTLRQAEIADANNFKFRFGYIKEKKQKRVDALIATDLVELSRNKSITDAYLLAGDEDHIIAVQLAQSFGVRVHLLSIDSTEGKTYDAYLKRECDSFTLLDKETIETILFFLENP